MSTTPTKEFEQSYNQLIEKLDYCLETAQAQNEQHKKKREQQLDVVEFSFQKICGNKLFDKSNYLNTKLTNK